MNAVASNKIIPLHHGRWGTCVAERGRGEVTLLPADYVMEVKPLLVTWVIGNVGIYFLNAI